jgi:hypothetical protein
LVNDKDERLFIAVKGRLDGSDSPVTGTMLADTVAYRMLDNHTIEGIVKKNGLIVMFSGRIYIITCLIVVGYKG